MTSAEALQKLRTSPWQFLKHYPINPAGATAGILPNQANLTQFKIYKPDNPGGTRGHLGATRPGTIITSWTHEISSFKIATAPNVPQQYGGAQFTALVVPMVYWDQIPLDMGLPEISRLDAYLLDGSAQIMITGQLSNCCFCFVQSGADLACTHMNPRGSEGTPVQMQQTLKNIGGFANYAGAFGTYGRENYPGYANVIGVRVGGTWRLYSQQSNDMFKTITGAFQIYPGPVTPL